MKKTKDIFGIEESSSFARALAASEGVAVKEVKDAIEPYSTSDGKIMMGTPSLYNHDSYMGSLHREISKQMKDMRFFYKSEEKDELRKVAKDILQSQVTEYHQNGTYEGRDRILREQYRRNMDSAGGISQVVENLAKKNPTAAAMVYIGNELRNDWQGFLNCKMPPEIKGEVERLEPVLKENWLKIKSEEDLNRILQEIQYAENRGNGGDGEDDGNDGDAGQDGKSGKDGEGSDSKQQQSSGESAESGMDGKESPEGEGDAGEGKDESDSEPSDGSSGDGSETPENSGQTEGSGEGEGSGESSEGSEGSDGREGSGREEGRSKDGASSVGACEASKYLRDIGVIKDAVKPGESVKKDKVPYIPGNSCIREDITDNVGIGNQGYHTSISKELDGFSLSRKIKKYLISLSQVGFEYGLKRGRICQKNIARLYTSTGQPRIFKERNSTRIQEDSAIFILGDCSGSMSGRKYTVSSACQISMSEVLQSLHIPHMMMLFSTSGHDRNHFIMKKFDEYTVSRDKLLKRYSDGRISMGCNADGEAVTEAAQLLAKRPEKNKLLIVLSDGEPAYGYGDDERFLKDTVKAIEDSKLMNIVGIGINSHAVKEYYSESRVVGKVEELEKVLIELLKKNVLK